MPRQYFYEGINWQETSPCARLQITWNICVLLHCKSMLIWAADWWDWCASWDKDETFSLWHPPTPPLCTHACNNSWQQNINRVSTSGRISSFNILCPTLAKARNRKVTGVGVHSPVIPMYLHIYGNNRILITENRFYQKERSLCVLTWLTSLILDGSHYNFLIALLCFWIILHRSLYLKKDIIKLNYAWVKPFSTYYRREHIHWST